MLAVTVIECYDLLEKNSEVAIAATYAPVLSSKWQRKELILHMFLQSYTIQYLYSLLKNIYIKFFGLANHMCVYCSCSLMVVIAQV